MRSPELLLGATLALSACDGDTSVQIGSDTASETGLSPYSDTEDTAEDTDSGSSNADSGSNGGNTGAQELPSVIDTTAAYCQDVLDNDGLNLIDTGLAVDFYGPAEATYTPDDVRYPTEGGSFVDAYTENSPDDGTRTLIACAYTQPNTAHVEPTAFGVDLSDYGDGVVQATVPDLTHLEGGTLKVWAGDIDASGLRGFDATPAVYTVVVNHEGDSVNIIR